VQTQHRARVAQLILAGVLLLVPGISAAETLKPKQNADEPPSTFQLFSEKFDRSVSVSCKPKDRDDPRPRSVTCEFLEVTFQPANEKKLADAERELELQPTPSEKDVAQSHKEGEDLAKTLGPFLNDPRFGPRGKAYLRDAINKKDDPKALARLMIERERRTCTLYAEGYKLDFKRIGEGKWVSNPEPQGLCNVVAVYTLEHLDLDKFSWKFSIQIVARGGPKKNLLCDWADEKQAKEPEVFSNEKGNGEFEPPCDFINYRLSPTWPDTEPK
jgi:hypothetical protein